MALEPNPAEQWDRVAAELRAYKEAQQQAWGDIDNATLGRYLAGDLSRDERQHVEEALTQLPELRKLTDIVRDVLDETALGATAPDTVAPPILAFPQQRRKANPWFGRALRSRGALLAASLLLGLGLVLVSMRLYTTMGQTSPLLPSVGLGQPVAERPNGLQVAMGNPPGKAEESADKRSLPLMMATRTAPKDKAMVEGWKQVGTSATTMLAATQEELGDFYQQKGDYDRAEALLATARDLRRQVHGDHAPQTVQTSQKLAAVYERATQQQIQLIARRHHVVFHAETVASLADSDAKNALERAKDGPNVITLIICREPPSVQVVIAESLRKKGFTPECQAELQKLVERSVRKHEVDRGLLQAVRYVTQHCECCAQRTKLTAGAGLGSAGATILGD